MGHAAMNGFSFLLKTLRSESGVSQHELALEIGRDQKYVAQLENSRHEPRLQSLKRLIDALGGRLIIRMKDKDFIMSEHNPDFKAVHKEKPTWEFGGVWQGRDEKGKETEHWYELVQAGEDISTLHLSYQIGEPRFWPLTVVHTTLKHGKCHGQNVFHELVQKGQWFWMRVI